MLEYTLQRLFQSFLVLVAITLIGFALFRFVGDPVTNMVGQDTSAAEVEQMRQELGLNDSIPVQFIRYIGKLFEGNLGMSFRHGRPVVDLFRERFPATLELALASTLFALLMAIPLGVFTGLYPNSRVSQLVLGISLAGVSLPTFLIGILLILVFSVLLDWLPAFGRGDTITIGVWRTGYLTPSGLVHLILPAITLGMFQMTLILRLVRSEMLEVLQTDFIKFARARGLTNRAVNFGHALKNTLIPVITIVGLQLGFILAFAIITETVFQWPGMGLLFLQAIEFADLPVMSGYLIVIGSIFVVINLVVDMLYFLVDPRLRKRASRQGGT